MSITTLEIVGIAIGLITIIVEAVVIYMLGLHVKHLERHVALLD